MALRVKICGLTNFDDALVAAESGADMLGFVFVPHTPRFIEPEKAHQIITTLKSRGLASCCVGVFADQTPEHIHSVMRQVPLDKIQLHGNEPAEMLSALDADVYKAIRPRSIQEAQALAPPYVLAVKAHPPALLIDTYHPHCYGGTGERSDWTLARALAAIYPLVLAGGLTVENVAEAIRAVRPWGVDVSSGVERAKGLKDHIKVREFCRAAKGVES